MCKCISIVVRVAWSCFLRIRLLLALRGGGIWDGRCTASCIAVAIESQHNEGHVHSGWAGASGGGKGEDMPGVLCGQRKTCRIRLMCARKIAYVGNPAREDRNLMPPLLSRPGVSLRSTLTIHILVY